MLLILDIFRPFFFIRTGETGNQIKSWQPINSPHYEYHSPVSFSD